MNRYSMRILYNVPLMQEHSQVFHSPTVSSSNTTPPIHPSPPSHTISPPLALLRRLFIPLRALPSHYSDQYPGCHLLRIARRRFSPSALALPPSLDHSPRPRPYNHWPDRCFLRESRQRPHCHARCHLWARWRVVV